MPSTIIVEGTSRGKARVQDGSSTAIHSISMCNSDGEKAEVIEEGCEGGQPGERSLLGTSDGLCLGVLPHGQVEHERIKERQ